MGKYRSIVPNININTSSEQLRTEILNYTNRLDAQLSTAPYKLFSFNGPAGSSSTVETTLATYTVDFGTLTKQGSSLIFFVSGKTAANVNNKTLKVYFGSTVIYTSGSFAGNNTSWALYGEIVRNGAASELTYVSWQNSAVAGTTVTTATATESLAVSQIFKVTGQGTTNDDISLYTCRVLLST